MKVNNYEYCLIYCRVSSVRQVVDGNGLGSQEQRCRERAKSQGYIVEKVFGDSGISGSLFDRPAMMSLIEYLDAHPNKKFVVIFDDLKRFARDYLVHLKIKSELISRGVKLECLNFNFEDSAESEFIEGVLALQAQLERQQNRRQVVQKQQSRLERGFWPFCPPLGYQHIKSAADGKVLTPREPYSEIFKGAFEQYEKDLLITQEDVRQYIQNKYKENGIERPISIHGVQETLRNPLYAGFIEYEKWRVKRRIGNHKGIISKETFDNVQAKLEGRKNVILRKDYQADFPLRGWVRCAYCDHKLTASWVGGRSKHYPLYSCINRECSHRYKSIRKVDIETDFEATLSRARVSSDITSLAKAIFLDAWQEQSELAAISNKEREQKISSLDNQITSFANLVAKSQGNQSLVEVYESEIQKLLKEKQSISQLVPSTGMTKEDFGTKLDSVIQILENPLILWKSESAANKAVIQNMYFDEPPKYSHEVGFGTVRFSESINLFSSFDSQKTLDVEMRGNEPLSATAD